MLATTTLGGHRAVSLENKILRVTVLPEKGADIAEIVHRPSGIGLLMKTPEGLRPPTGKPAADFLENYEGGWQELFPSANDSCQYRGETIPFHGEVALLPWEWSVERDDDQEAAIRLTVHTQRTPWRLDRVMRLKTASRALEIEETAWNVSDQPLDLVWGHHVVLGAPFLEAGCEVDLPGELVCTPDELYEPATAQLAPGQRASWPLANGRLPGETIDLSRVLGPEARVHDEAYVTGLRQGRLSVTNRRLGLRFSLEWDAKVFRWVVLWRPYGGADLPPLTGIYGLGVEPWVTRYDLARAVQRGEALTLGPRQSFSTRLVASVSETPDPAAGT
jgi:galactose mutarotase-like enzyme